jgi:hypothetical protein
MSPATRAALFSAIPVALPSRANWARLRISILYLWRHGYLPNLDEPRLFSEWVQWRKLKDRDLSLAVLTDKLAAKALATDVLGAEFVIPTLWHGNQLPATPPWPMPFIVKANHGCQQFVVVRCDADWRHARRKAPNWLRSAYGKWLDEWHYGRARRTLLVEPFVGPAAGLPTDYKVFVFGGVARFIQVHVGRGEDHRWVQYDRQWRRVSDGSDDLAAPSKLGEMLRAAEEMAGCRDHLRVDFYEVNGRLWFGETCLFPGSGLDRFAPVTLDEAFGRYWTAAASRDLLESAASASTFADISQRPDYRLALSHWISGRRSRASRSGRRAIWRPGR